MDYIFSLPLLMVICSPGFLGLFFGIRLIRNRNEKNIKGCIGVLVISGGFWLAVTSSKLFPENFGVTLSILLTVLLMLPVYSSLSKYMIKAECLKFENQDRFFGKGSIAMIAFLLWLLLSQIIDTYASTNENSWDLIGLIVPIVVAWAFYRISIKAICSCKFRSTRVKKDSKN